MTPESTQCILIFALGVFIGMIIFLRRTEAKLKYKRAVYASLILSAAGCVIGVIVIGKQNSGILPVEQLVFFIVMSGVMVGTLVSAILAKVKFFGIEYEDD
ncbi:MAG: hypothetical protein LBL41_04140 [Bifidobacteriaceae bacterium]|jgi:hypothetical protein|nr:hypothetical protein [Bifidobacteriaceae bacterium]